MLRAVKDVCELQENALDIRVSDQIEKLEELLNEEGNYEDFFNRTFITKGMYTLVSEGIARLAAKSNQAVFHLKQAMGGGKTHLLVGFGLLARFPELRQKYCSDMLHIDAFDSAEIAAFNGRNNPIEFFWGAIAKQLGKPELFKDFWANGPKAPDEKDWINLFDRNKPILLLFDEMPPYFHYYDTQKVGNGTVADIATRAFANMLTAAGKKANVCVVVSDLSATYDTGTRLINKALENARHELGRQERNITPVDLEGNEIYDILRKRLFKKLPERGVIEDVAALYGRALEEATKAKVASRGAEAIADEILNTYPFHPMLKNLIALFKENEKFKQTRGLLELISRLLKSVWEGRSSDACLIGPNHFDLSIPDVREKIAEISEMRDVIAKDLWDSNHSAHAQIIDLNKGNDATAQIGALLLTASLSTAVIAVKGLTKEEMVECLSTPVRPPSDFLSAFEELENSAWYLHHTPEGRYYFDRQENLTKLLQSLAVDAPDNKVDDIIRRRLLDMFKPVRKVAYDEVLPRPNLSEIVDKVRKSRTLLIIDPNSTFPPEEVVKFFESMAQKNNICVLTGEKTQMGNVEKAARQYYAVSKAIESRIPKGHPQRDDLEEKQVSYDKDFNSTILNLFDKVLFPIQRPGRAPSLQAKGLEMSRDVSKPFVGEEQIVVTLTKDPLKLYLDIEDKFDTIRDKIENLLWHENTEMMRWTDVLDRQSEQAGMVWLPPNGLEQVKIIAINRGLWEELGNGYITKNPKKKKTSAQIFKTSGPNVEGYIRLQITPINAGPAPKIYYTEDGPVTDKSKHLTEADIHTNALRISVIVVDPSGQFETGDPVVYSNNPVIRSKLEVNVKRLVELMVAPKGKLYYTLDGSEPREGTPYSQPIEIGDNECIVRTFAVCEGLETKEDFYFREKGKKGLKIDDCKPAKLIGKEDKRFDSRSKTFNGLKEARERKVTFEKVNITIGGGSQAARLLVGEITVDAEYIEIILEAILKKFEPTSPISMAFSRANFLSGYDLKQFVEYMGLHVEDGEVEQ